MSLEERISKLEKIITLLERVTDKEKDKQDEIAKTFLELHKNIDERLIALEDDK